MVKMTIKKSKYISRFFMSLYFFSNKQMECIVVDPGFLLVKLAKQSGGGEAVLFF